MENVESFVPPLNLYMVRMVTIAALMTKPDDESTPESVDGSNQTKQDITLEPTQVQKNAYNQIITEGNNTIDISTLNRPLNYQKKILKDCYNESSLKTFIAYMHSKIMRESVDVVCDESVLKEFFKEYYEIDTIKSSIMGQSLYSFHVDYTNSNTKNAEQTGVNEQTTLTVYQSAFSRKNLSKKIGFSNNIVNAEPDSKITLYGILTSLTLKKRREYVSVNRKVFVSPLIRSWMTAICLFGDEVDTSKNNQGMNVSHFILVVSPFLMEESFIHDVSNQRKPLLEQVQTILLFIQFLILELLPFLSSLLEKIDDTDVNEIMNEVIESKTLVNRFMDTIDKTQNFLKKGLTTSNPKIPDINSEVSVSNNPVTRQNFLSKLNIFSNINNVDSNRQIKDLDYSNIYDGNNTNSRTENITNNTNKYLPSFFNRKNDEKNNVIYTDNPLKKTNQTNSNSQKKDETKDKKKYGKNYSDIYNGINGIFNLIGGAPTNNEKTKNEIKIFITNAKIKLEKISNIKSYYIHDYDTSYVIRINDTKNVPIGIITETNIKMLGDDELLNAYFLNELKLVHGIPQPHSRFLRWFNRTCETSSENKFIDFTLCKVNEKQVVDPKNSGGSQSSSNQNNSINKNDTSSSILNNKSQDRNSGSNKKTKKYNKDGKQKKTKKIRNPPSQNQTPL